MLVPRRVYALVSFTGDFMLLNKLESLQRNSSRIPYRKTAWEWLESMVLFTNWFWLICRKYEHDISIHTRMLWAWILSISGSLEAAPLTNKKRQPTVAMQCPYQKTYITLLMNTVYIYIHVPKLTFVIVINPSSGQTFAWTKLPNKRNDRTRFMLRRSNEFVLLLEDYWQRPTKISSG